jgi:hypothetical protein
VVDEQQSSLPANGAIAARPLALAALLLFAACSRSCGEKNAAAAEELLPPHPPGAVVTAPLGSLSQHLASLSDRIVQIPGGEQVADLRKGLVSQLGFDPFSREGLLSAGLDPDRGAALSLFGTEARPPFSLALPLTNPDLFLEKAQKLLVERAGFSPLPPAGSGAKLFERRGVQLALAVVRGYGVIARGPEAAKLVAEAQARKPEQSLAKDAGLMAAKTKLGEPDLLVYAPAGSALPARYGAPPLPGDFSLSVAGSAQGLAIRAVALLPPDWAAKMQAALPGGGAWLATLLPQNAPLRARLGIAPQQLLTLAHDLPQLAPLLDKLDLAALFGSLQPGAAISLGIEKTANLAHLVDYGLDWRHESPFQTLQFVALAQVADAQKFLDAAATLAQKLPSVGAQAARVQDEWSVTYAGGKGARFGLRDIDGKKVAYVIGGAIEAASLKAGATEKDPEVAALVQDPGAVLRADFGKLYDAIHGLPEGTFGSGPQSYVTRSVLTQVIDPLRAVRVSAGAMAYPDSLGASIDLELVAQ